MKKGERRRADILLIAEELFYAKGYEATTIQDILSILDLSKGGFYHHFESKEQLLEALCDDKIRAAVERGRGEAGAAYGGAVDKLNALTDGSCIWRRENADFLGLFLRIAYRDENVLMRETYKKLVASYMAGDVERIVKEGLASGEFSAPEGIARLAMTTLGALTDDIAVMMIQAERTPPGAAAILELLELYRKALERMLNAPYGTVVIHQMGSMAPACQVIWQRHARALHSVSIEEG